MTKIKAQKGLLKGSVIKKKLLLYVCVCTYHLVMRTHV